MKSYFSLVKFAHTIFALPFAFLSFFLAVKVRDSAIDWTVFLLVFLCMVFARSAAMAFNRYVDREIDARNQRTVTREIPAGVVSARAAFIFTSISAAAFILTTYYLNPLCFYLSPVALLVILGYSYTKRFTWLCHFVLGVGLGLAPVGAYIAVTGSFELLPVLYGIMVMLWVSGFDILYALQDAQFDRDQGLHSVPGRFGQQKAKRISAGLHVVCAVMLLIISWYQSSLIPSLGILHWIGALGFMGLLVWQHYLVKKYDLERIDKAFFETNGIASILFGMAVIADVLF